MRVYLKIYRWSLQMKLRMGLYTVSLVFLKAVCDALRGVYSIPMLDLLGMWLTAIVFAVAETAILPAGREHPRWATVLWAAVGNLVFVGASLWQGWFTGVPVWGAALLILVLEFGLWAMWFGDNVVMRMDSAELDRQLKQFQQHNGPQV